MKTVTHYGVLVSHPVGEHIIECSDRAEAKRIVRGHRRAPGQTLELVTREVQIGEWRTAAGEVAR